MINQESAGQQLPGFFVSMWHDLLVALALVMIIEGILPFLNPNGMRNMMRMMSEMEERTLRMTGLVSMLVGVAALYLIN